MRQQINTPTLVKNINAYVAIEGNNVGGNLYSVLSNKNISDRDIAYALIKCCDKGDQAGATLAKQLLSASKTQRLKACSSWTSTQYRNKVINGQYPSRKAQ